MLRLVSDRRAFYHSLVEFPTHHVYRNDRENTAYNRICSEQMDIIAIDFVKKMLLGLGGVVPCIFSTLYASFWMDNRTTTTSVKLPFVDAKSNAEFYVNLTFQFIIFWHSVFVYFGLESTMSLLENFASVSPKLLQLELTDCIASYERNELPELQLRAAFKNGVVQILDYER